jgi:hypothetical protein
MIGVLFTLPRITVNDLFFSFFFPLLFLHHPFFNSSTIFPLSTSEDALRLFLFLLESLHVCHVEDTPTLNSLLFIFFSRILCIIKSSVVLLL